MKRKHQGLVLGFQPSSQGFGWAAFSSPLSLYDWGLFHVKKKKNLHSLAKLSKLVERLQPETIVMEAYENGARRSDRVVRLCKAVAALCVDQRIEVAIYSRGQVKSCFSAVGASTRQEVAEAVARQFDALRPRLPKARAAWEAPDRRMAVFDAAAAVQTHFQVGTSHLFQELLSEEP